MPELTRKDTLEHKLAEIKDFIANGGVNFIGNPNAGSNTDGWATYANTAGSTPVNGTGGTPNITWTRNTITPLRGDADFKLHKDAANRQGEGVSYDFKIDRADINKQLSIKFQVDGSD